ncbi:hypothetical protein Tco_1321179 [Tanacetum coccineum]
MLEICAKPRVWDSKYFMEQRLLAKKDEVGVILTKEQNDFLLADTVQMEELEELSANICMMERIQPATIDYDEVPNYDSAFISEFINDKDKIIALEKERDELQLSVSAYKKQIFELQDTQSALKRKMNDDEDKYLNNILNMEAKVEDNENVTQGEIDELVKNMNQKTYAYADIRAQNQDLLITISELKSMLKTVEKDKMSTLAGLFDGTDTESEPFEDFVETETPESPLTIAPPTSLPKSTPPTLVPIVRWTACMVVHVPHAMSPSLYAIMAEVATMSDSAFCTRFRSSYEISPSSSPPDLPLRKCYRGTSELVEDDDVEEDEEIEESLDSDSMSEDVEDDGLTVEDKDPAIEDEGLAAGDEGPGMGVESHGLDDKSRGLDDEGHSVESDGLGLRKEDEAVPEGQQWAVPVVGAVGSGSASESERPERVLASRQPILTTWTDLEDGIVFIDVPAYPPPAPPVQTPPLPEWSFGSLPLSLSTSIVPSPISSPMIPLTVPSPVATPATAETGGFFTELGAQVEMQGGLIRDHAGENQELRLQLIEERRARIELDEIVNSMRRGQDPQGDV